MPKEKLKEKPEPKGAPKGAPKGKTKEQIQAESAAAKSVVNKAHQVIRKVTGSDQAISAGKLANLPIVSAVFDTKSEMERAITLLETGHRLKDEMERAKDGYEDPDTGHVMGLDETKEEITGIAMGAEVEGYRYGNLTVAVNLVAGRRTLNKDLLRDLLLGEGMDPVKVGEVIEKAHMDGSGYYRVEFRKLA